jgi:hypothetical protein
MAGVSVNTVTADDSDDEVSGICDSLLTPLEGGLSKLSVMKVRQVDSDSGPSRNWNKTKSPETLQRQRQSWVNITPNSSKTWSPRQTVCPSLFSVADSIVDKEEIERLRRRFLKLDRDGSGDSYGEKLTQDNLTAKNSFQYHK